MARNDLSLKNYTVEEIASYLHSMGLLVYEPASDRMKVEITLRLHPMGAVRTTKQGRFSPRAKKYHDYMNLVRTLYKQELVKLKLPVDTLPDGVMGSFEFGMPVPTGGKVKSAQRKMQARIGTPHTMKPDWDNLVKGVQDAIYHGRKKDDCDIYKVEGPIEKLWVPHGEGYVKFSFYIKVED